MIHLIKYIKFKLTAVLSNPIRIQLPSQSNSYFRCKKNKTENPSNHVSTKKENGGVVS